MQCFQREDTAGRATEYELMASQSTMCHLDLGFFKALLVYQPSNSAEKGVLYLLKPPVSSNLRTSDSENESFIQGLQVLRSHRIDDDTMEQKRLLSPEEGARTHPLFPQVATFLYFPESK